MNLSNFEEYIEDVILKRGRDYFNNGHVEGIEKEDNNLYIIDVVGSDEYIVGIFIDDDNQIIDAHCNCPYDFGEYCKHKAAALYALRQMKIDEKEPTIFKKQTKANTDLKTLLSNLKKEDLLQIIEDVVKDYPEIEKQLVFRFSQDETEVSISKKMMREYINLYKKGGFISWRDVDDALQGAEITLSRAQEKIEEGETKSAVLLSLAVLQIVMDMLNYSDDSSGSIDVIIYESLETIHEAIFDGFDQLNESLKDELLSNLLKESDHKRYDGWSDVQVALYKSIMLLCDTPNRRKKFDTQLNKNLESTSNNAWDSKYETENIKLIKLEMIERFNGEEQALQFIKENINLAPFRTKAIERLMESKKYSEALELCEEGKVADSKYPGIVSQWKRYELQAYEGLGDIQKQRELLMEFVYGNKYEYYKKLKELYQAGEWEVVLQKILATFEKQKYLPSTYLEILKQENLTEKILNYCKRNPSSINELSGYLLQDYEDEVNNLYIRYIELEAEKSTDRKQYQKVCSIIKQYEKIAGTIRVQKLINTLTQKYRRRPAFIDELEKIKKD